MVLRLVPEQTKILTADKSTVVQPIDTKLRAIFNAKVGELARCFEAGKSHRPSPRRRASDGWCFSRRATVEFSPVF